MRILYFAFIALCLLSCSKESASTLDQGYYRVVLNVQDNEKLPFIMNVTSKNTLEVYNAEEVIQVDEVRYSNDSVYIQTPVFEGYIAAKITADGFEGSFIKESLDRIVPVKAEKNNEVRFAIKNESKPVNMSGIWEMNFSGGSDDDEYVGKGIFEQSGNNLSGTMRTTTGDYRYLEGVVDGDEFKLSVFDGAHAFLFTGKVNDSTLNGVFYSGNHWKKNFTAKRNEAYELPSANTLTYIKEGYDKFTFSFPDENGTQISLEDERFKDKVTVVQIMGSWCPNCLDESKYYTKYLLENSEKDVEFIALAFEVAKTPEKAFQRIKRLRDRIGIEYPIVLAQYGGSNKKKAQEKLPMLNHVLSYPTSIFIDKKGNVRKIHTGFNGPATGQKYVDFTNEFEDFITHLLSE
jgi:thiol-disulfide isomerase/thioredoxin